MVSFWANSFPDKTGLYDPQFEKDGCGVGFLINIDGRETHNIVQSALDMLTNMSHRGASGDDPLDGDGAGIMSSMPHDFVHDQWKSTLFETISKAGIVEFLNNTCRFASNNTSSIEFWSKNLDLFCEALVNKDFYATGNIFFKPNDQSIKIAKSRFETVSKSVGLCTLGWRTVPTDSNYIGIISKQKQPTVIQPLVISASYIEELFSTETISNLKTESPISFIQSLQKQIQSLETTTLCFERKLYLLRKKAIVQIKAHCDGGEWFYICSLSSHRLVYKGLAIPEMIHKYYPDLRNPRFKAHYSLVHSRFSTNTFPSWDRAQPFRYCAHNGEINTLQGNKNWMKSREGQLKSKFFSNAELQELFPIIDEHGSDSQALDNVLELLVLGGELTLPEAVMVMVPEAWQNMNLLTGTPEDKKFNEIKKYFYEWASSIMEPWDGPALLTFSDHRYRGAVLDRNGLRPCRYYITNDNVLVCGSEVGTIKIDEQNIKSKGRLMPGKVLLVDTKIGRVVEDREIKNTICIKNDYKKWVHDKVIDIESMDIRSEKHTFSNAITKAITETKGKTSILSDPRMAVFNYSMEELYMIITPMIKDGKEALGSMGNDAILACLDTQPRLPFDYMRQMFAQVTNPPIDPIRESIVMSLECLVGPETNLLEIDSEQLARIKLCNFLLTENEFNALTKFNSRKHGDKKISNISIIKTRDSKLQNKKSFDWISTTIDTTFKKATGVQGYKQRINEICNKAAQSAKKGSKIIVLSDRKTDKENIPIFSLLVVGAVHHRLVEDKLRMNVAIVLEAGDVREVHHYCCLLGYGMDAVYPYFIYDIIKGLADENILQTNKTEKDMYIAKYRSSIQNGVKKVMSKMGISTLQSYKGAQRFEALGIADEVIDFCFKNTVSRIGGATFDTFASDSIALHEIGYPSFEKNKQIHDYSLSDLWKGFGTTGEYHWNREGVKHVNNPAAISKLQHSVREKNQTSWDEYTSEQWENGTKHCTLRGKLELEFDDKNKSIPIDEVESWTEIVKRFCTGGMSYGSISYEAHTTLAVAMNKLGGKSNSGEGGEDRERYKKLENGDHRRSAIKQVASGRFGVTSEYLVNADELQIKIAQGAKPGEGGELPGDKVTGKIAETRHSTEGVGLISPPPHHDIYSIEDLKQLIYDLKGANPEARISVKLVSQNGVGVVAAGVAKAGANHVVIAGHDGGTGASRWTGIKYAGLPWELGVVETHQTLILNNLRKHVVIQTDGQIKTGMDIVLAGILGADEFGFATGPLIALGCTMMRKCHLNLCPVGIATQDPVLREKFLGKPEHVINFFYYLAEDVRKIMSKLGVKKFEDLIGKYNLVKTVNKTGAESHSKAKTISLDGMLTMVQEKHVFEKDKEPGNTDKREFDTGISDRLEYKMIEKITNDIKNGNLNTNISGEITNVDRGFGALTSYHISKHHGARGLPQGKIHIKLSGSAGQSFGAFLAKGVELELEGDCNDYVGKGLSGGTLIVYPPKESRFASEKNVIVGNVCLYGATGGEAYISGIAAERFAVRNSGAIAVVEGLGDHGCEYMTGGRVIILGRTGRNFAAGMSGGVAYLFEEDLEEFKGNLNPELVELETLDINDEETNTVRSYIEKHIKYTGSKIAQRVVANWKDSIRKCIKVIPVDYKKLLNKNKEKPKIKAEENIFKTETTITDLEDIIQEKGKEKRKTMMIDKKKGFMEQKRQSEGERKVFERTKDWEEVKLIMKGKPLKIQASRCMDCGVPFCQSDYSGCPLGNKIPQWNDLVYNETWKDAFESLMATNNFPEFTGRVCPAPCEGACVLGINEQPVGIKTIEAAIIERAWEEGWMKASVPLNRTGYSVAIIGSGPAGLAAADQLNQAGHTVVVYERADRVGGLLTYGIPNMKLDKKLIQRRIDKMASEGVRFVVNTQVGKNISFHQLQHSFDAVLLAVGSTVPRDLKIEGRELNGIEFAVEFLTDTTKKVIQSKGMVDLSNENVEGKHVVVIGGGDTGTDCIASSVRFKAKSITNLELLPQPPAVRATDNPWPLFPRTFKMDYGHKEAETVYGSDPRIFCVSTRRFIGNAQGDVEGIEIEKIEWIKDPTTGRWNISTVPNSVKVIPADYVLISMGFTGPEKMVLEEAKVDMNTEKTYSGIDEYSTNIPGVFSAGDCRRGQSLVVWAINEGRQAARAIDQYFIDMQSKKHSLKSNSRLPATGGVLERPVTLDY
ncbi:hypothetical protein BB560_003349 [Smittium megazygosporum]|uniref:glutamate synthase (NADH) n=1 Tax=Smittium megazygosporum TaxID=133381 RepID=A0A2T9ZC79_9FUNG|nr:hypothetical protein BB560_003349 [Smittium megazygosporum]